MLLFNYATPNKTYSAFCEKRVGLRSSIKSAPNMPGHKLGMHVTEQGSGLEMYTSICFSYKQTH